MALKDWIKKSTTKLGDIEQITYKNEKGDTLKIYGNKSKGKWEVNFGEFHPYLIKIKTLREFKTKSKALKYARDFMKKH